MKANSVVLAACVIGFAVCYLCRDDQEKPDTITIIEPHAAEDNKVGRTLPIRNVLDSSDRFHSNAPPEGSRTWQVILISKDKKVTYTAVED